MATRTTRFSIRKHPLLTLALAALAAGAEWRPAKGPLMTRWAKDVAPERVLPEYPRPQMRRDRWLNLNGVWQLAFAKEGEAVPTGKDLSEKVLVPFPVESALSGVMKHADRLWYRRLFAVPKDWSGQRVLLHFGAVDWEAVVWVNGKKVGDHRGGYDAFSFDITDALKEGREQELIVGVWDPTDAGTQPRGKQVLKPGGIYYTPTTGIWQTVWLEPMPPKGIVDLKIIPDAAARKATVTVRAGDKADEGTIKLTCSDGKETVARAEGKAGVPIELAVPDGKLWTPDAPFLYDLRVELLRQEKPVDRVESYFGLRSVSVGHDGKGVPRILLNGKPLFQVGPLDQGFWPDGLYTAPTDEALKFDIEITRKLGFNMARKHVKVEPQRWYYWCDRLGLLVWQDMPSGDRGIGPGDPDLVRTPESAAQYDRELEAMIDGLHNHPCIILWVVFNEGWGQFDTRRVAEWTKKYDPTRLVDCASGWADRGVGDVHDVHVYPGPGAPPAEKTRAAVLGEFGGLGLGVDGHTWTSKTWGYRGAGSKADLTRKYEKLLQGVDRLKDDRLCAAVYTQTTDVETEANGLLTYDREVVKVDLDRVARANRGDFSKVPQVVELVPTGIKKAQTWRYTFEKPEGDWFATDFNDSGWKQGKGGFGTSGTPGSVVWTVWNTPDIWIRRECTLPEKLPAEVLLLMHHDEDAEVYLNGVLAVKVKGYLTQYEEFALSPEARAALKPGKNTIAVHCHQTTGGQYIDVGLAGLKE